MLPRAPRQSHRQSIAATPPGTTCEESDPLRGIAVVAMPFIWGGFFFFLWLGGLTLGSVDGWIDPAVEQRPVVVRQTPGSASPSAPPVPRGFVFRFLSFLFFPWAGDHISSAPCPRGVDGCVTTMTATTTI